MISTLVAGAESADRDAEWPAVSWGAVTRAGVLANLVPREFGGAGRDPVEALDEVRVVAAACLTTAFILSQRDAAVKRLLAGPRHLQERYLPRLATGESFATVGLSQLTTSRQYGSAALKATEAGDGFRLDGEVPWITAADRAQLFVIGATLPEGRQILAALPSDRAGLSVSPPMPLSSLMGSRTTSILCDGVRVDPGELLGGPAEKVLGSVGGGGLDTSCLALGLASASVSELRREGLTRPELAPVAASFEAAATGAQSELRRLAWLAAPPPEATLALRVRATQLALAASQAALMAAKGAGFLSGHAASRRARQALFFLVWSCPRPVAEGVMDALTPAASFGECDPATPGG